MNTKAADRSTERAQRETTAWRLVVVYGLDGYNPEEVRQMTGVPSRQVMAMSEAKKALLLSGKDPRDFETWLSVVEHQKAEKAAKAEAARRKLPRVRCSQTFSGGKPTLWAIQAAPEALKGDDRVPQRISLQYPGNGHSFSAAEAWGRQHLVEYREKYRRVLDGTSQGFTGPDPLTPKPLTNQRMWEEFRAGKTFSEIIRINSAVDQLRAREVERVYHAFIDTERYGGNGDPCDVSDKGNYEKVAAWLAGRPTRLKARKAAEAAKRAEEKAKRVPELPAGVYPATVAQEKEEASADQWPEGFGGDDLDRKTASLSDLTAIELDAGEDAQ